MRYYIVQAGLFAGLVLAIVGFILAMVNNSGNGFNIALTGIVCNLALIVQMGE